MRILNGTGLRLTGQVLNLVTLIVGVAAAYFLTIQSLKIELAEKAENAVVVTLDKKLAHLEVMIREGVISKEQFYRFSQDINARLTRIEYYLMEHKGDSLGTR
jgi:hypothetical protein